MSYLILKTILLFIYTPVILDIGKDAYNYIYEIPIGKIIAHKLDNNILIPMKRCKCKVCTQNRQKGVREIH
jgi:L-lactate utilization protein LutB